MRHHLIQAGAVTKQVANDLADLAQAKFRQSQLKIRSRPRRQRPFGTVGQHHQDPSAFHCRDPGFQKVLAGFVQPVQILDDDHRGLRPCGLRDPADGFAQAHASRRRVDGAGCRFRASQKIRQWRKMLGDRQGKHRQGLLDPRPCRFGGHVRLDAEEGPQCLQHRHQRRRAAVNLRTRFQHPDLTFAAPFAELETKPAFADAGGAGDTDDPWRAWRGIRERTLQGLQLGCPPPHGHQRRAAEMLAVDGRFQADQPEDLHRIGNTLQRTWTECLGVAIGAEQGLAIAAQANLARRRFVLDPAGQMHREARHVLFDR